MITTIALQFHVIHCFYWCNSFVLPRNAGRISVKLLPKQNGHSLSPSEWILHGMCVHSIKKMSYWKSNSGVNVFSAARIFLLLPLDLAYTELPYGTTILYLTFALSALYQQSSLDIGDQCLSVRFQHSSISTLIKREFAFFERVPL